MRKSWLAVAAAMLTHQQPQATDPVCDLGMLLTERVPQIVNFILYIHLFTTYGVNDRINSFSHPKKNRTENSRVREVICSSAQYSTLEVSSFVALHGITDHGLTRENSGNAAANTLIPRCDAYEMETNIKLSIKAHRLFVCVCIEKQLVQPKMTCILFFFVDTEYASCQ